MERGAREEGSRSERDLKMTDLCNEHKAVLLQSEHTTQLLTELKADVKQVNEKIDEIQLLVSQIEGMGKLLKFVYPVLSALIGAGVAALGLSI